MYALKDNIKDSSLLNSFYSNAVITDKDTQDIAACDDLLCFIVGGTQFQTLKSQFAFWPTTRLSRLIRAKKKKQILNLCDKVIFCENTGTVKKYIFLRNGSNFNAILDT